MMTETRELASRWQALRATTPNVRTRDAAAQLGVSEAELLATTVGSTAVQLDDDFASLLHAMTEVGRCMALTRNEHAVIEVRGRYGGVDLAAHGGLVLGEHIDLRVFLTRWKHGFAVDEPHPHREGERRRSIHVFDAAGVAVHKIYLESDGDARAWDAIVATRTSSRPLVIEPAPARPVERPDAEIDVAAFLAAWDGMQDTHEFFPLLRKHGVSRTQALRLAGTQRARRVDNSALDRVLRDAKDARTNIMIFVGNPGCIEIFSGTIDRVVRHGPWLNVLDPGFNLHVREDRIASSWVVAKPTSAGVVTSLELFDAEGENIALLFRKRDDREKPEDPEWQAMLDRIPETA